MPVLLPRQRVCVREESGLNIRLCGSSSEQNPNHSKTAILGGSMLSAVPPDAGACGTAACASTSAQSGTMHRKYLTNPQWEQENLAAMAPHFPHTSVASHSHTLSGTLVLRRTRGCFRTARLAD